MPRSRFDPPSLRLHEMYQFGLSSCFFFVHFFNFFLVDRHVLQCNVKHYNSGLVISLTLMVFIDSSHCDLNTRQCLSSEYRRSLGRHFQLQLALGFIILRLLCTARFPRGFFGSFSLPHRVAGDG